MSKRLYKAIISDIDGTLTPNVPRALPSDKVTNSIKKAISCGLVVSLASGRPFSLVEYLTTHLGLSSPIIVDNGAVIVDGKDGSILWEANLPKTVVLKILGFTNKFKLTRVSTDTGVLENPKEIPSSPKFRKISVHDLTPETADKLIENVSNDVKEIAIVKASSYQGEGFTDVYFSHAEATKQHAVFKYAELLGISTEEIIGVGDGYNDFSLLMACGLKVAMGNAVEDLKAIADYVAPSVENDGLSDVIKKYILKS